jgi:hypothetical protein
MSSNEQLSRESGLLSSTDAENHSAFIYPIRSAVSVKPLVASKTFDEQTVTEPWSRQSSISSSSSTHQKHEAPSIATAQGEGLIQDVTSHLTHEQDESEGHEGSSSQEISMVQGQEALSVSLRKHSLDHINTGLETKRPTESTDEEHTRAMIQPRFRYVQTEAGHLAVVGREGVIKRCEDEPIHLPGAVQSFGCLVVVREDNEGRLVVRQVSEVRAQVS